MSRWTIIRLVGPGQAFGDLASDLDGALEVELPLGDQSADGPAFDILHGDEHRAAGLVDVIDRGDGGMADGGGRLSLDKEAALAHRVGDQLGLEYLQGDRALEPGVAGPVDHTHPAHAEQFLDLIVFERLADHGFLRRLPYLIAHDAGGHNTSAGSDALAHDKYGRLIYCPQFFILAKDGFPEGSRLPGHRQPDEEADGRPSEGRERLALTPKGRELAVSLDPVWGCFESAAAELFAGAGIDMLDAVQRVEAELDREEMGFFAANM